MEKMEIYLQPTPSIDCDNEIIKEKAESLTRDLQEVSDKAKSLFYFVRDTIEYNLYAPSNLLEYYRASRIIQVQEGFCVQKAMLLIALARAVGIPARLHLVALRNHLIPEKVRELLTTNVLPTHGYSELYIDGRWVKATPAFTLKLCQRNRLIPVEFDGKHDAMFPSHNLDGELHMEYIKDYGYYDDIPLDKIINLRIQTFGADFAERIEKASKEREKARRNR